MLKIVVCIKQVPDTAHVRMNPETNTLMREGLESILNPFDESALELALRLKASVGAVVTVVTMGPPQAEAVLREALAKGADRAFLVSSKAFGGADTLATSYALSQAIKALDADCAPDLVLFGKQAIDGDTAQVGPEVSEMLGFPLVPYVSSVACADANQYTAISKTPAGEAEIAGHFPAVMTVVREGLEPRFASLARTLSAAKAAIVTLDERAIAADADRLGLKGSATKVVRTFPPAVRAAGRKTVWQGNARELLDEIRR